jgi:Uma2 family endonuclease
MDKSHEKTEYIIANISFQEFLKQFEGKRAEWLMGNVELLITNNTIHQKILGFLAALFQFYLGVKISGEFLLDGVSMYVGDDKPAREPDGMVILGKNVQRIMPTYYDGAADIVIEIVSPESEDRDYKTKMNEYATAGVLEYWLFDPQKKVAFINALNPNGKYERLSLNSEGKMGSGLLPGFAIDPTIFWREELPKGAELIALVQGMI